MVDDERPELRRRKWVPNVSELADELVRDFPSGKDEGRWQLDIDKTLESWQGKAQSHGDEFTEDDLLALVHELVRRVALLGQGLRPEEW